MRYSSFLAFPKNAFEIFFCHSFACFCLQALFFLTVELSHHSLRPVELTFLIFSHSDLSLHFVRFSGYIQFSMCSLQKVKQIPVKWSATPFFFTNGVNFVNKIDMNANGFASTFSVRRQETDTPAWLIVKWGHCLILKNKGWQNSNTSGWPSIFYSSRVWQSFCWGRMKLFPIRILGSSLASYSALTAKTCSTVKFTVL